MTDHASPSLPDRVRTACAAVTERARAVSLDRRAVATYADTIPLDDVAAPTLAPGDLPAADPEGIAAWVLTVNAVNFGSGWFPVLHKRPGLSGSKTVFACLRERFETAGPFPADVLATIDTATVAALFEQDPAGPAADLMAAFARAWNHLGTALHTRWGGRFAALVEDGDGSAARLAGLLAEIDGWDDRSTHDGIDVPLFKRAQIVPAHLAMAWSGRGLGAFDDLDRLTIFADNLVPHVLRIDGVLRFDPALVERIEREDLLPAGSAEEVEIRAVAVTAAEAIVDTLRHRGHRATAMGLDQILWNRGGEARYKARPRHRSRSTAY